MRRVDARKLYWATSLVFALATSTIFTLDMVYQVKVAGLDALQLVLVGTALEATCFLFEIPTGVVADLYSRRLSTIIGFVLVGLAFAFEGLFPRFGIILLAQIGWGLGWTFISGAHDAWIADEVGAENAGPVYMRSTQMGQIGALLGIPLAMVLGSTRLALPIIVGGLAITAWGLVLALIMPEDNFSPAPPEERESWRAMLATAREGASLVRRRPILVTLMLVSLFVGLSSEGYDRLWTAHMLENFSRQAVSAWSDAIWFGLISAVCTVSTLIATEWARRRVDAQDGQRVGRALAWIYGLMVIGLGALTVAGGLAPALVGVVAYSALRGTAEPLETTWINQQIDSKVRATVLSMSGQVNAVGQVLGGPAVGAIGRGIGLRAALGVSTLLTAPIVWLYGRTRGKPTTEDTKA